MRVTLLSGAAGTGLAHQLGSSCDLTVIAPTTRDSWADGLKRSPDLDAFLTRVAQPTFGVAQALADLGFGTDWQRAHDEEIALRIMRTELLHAEFTLTQATAALAERRSLNFSLLPLSDDRGELRVVIGDPDEGQQAIHLDEYRANVSSDVPEPMLIAMKWVLTPEVLAAVRDAEQMTVAVMGTDPVMMHATRAIADVVPRVRFIDVASASADEVVRAVASPR